MDGSNCPNNGCGSYDAAGIMSICGECYKEFFVGNPTEEELQDLISEIYKEFDACAGNASMSPTVVKKEENGCKVEHKVADGRILKRDQVIYDPSSSSSLGVAEMGDQVNTRNDTSVAENEANPDVADKDAAEVEGEKALEMLD